MSAPVALCGASVVVAYDPPEVVTGDLVLEDGRVRGFAPLPEGIVKRDCRGTVIVPGNVCAHHHLYSALACGMPYRLEAPSDFLEILQRIWWRLDRALDEESIRASALLGALEALRCGTTSIVDHHASPNFIEGSLDAIADALGELGARAVLCYEVTDRDGEARSKAGIDENRRFLSAPRPLARGMVGAHASFTLSDDTLAACADAARDLGAGLHIHVAEDAVDEQDAVARFGKRVIERLVEHGALDDRALLAHCVHVNEREMKLVESAGATVVCNPRSNMNNGVGHSPFTNREGRVALGTDGIGGDLVAEAQAGFFRGARPSSTLLSPGHSRDSPSRSASSVASTTSRSSARSARVRRPISPSSPMTRRRPSTPRPSPAISSSDGPRDAYATFTSPATGSSTTVVRPWSTRQGSPRLVTRPRSRLWQRLDGIPAHDYTPEVKRTR